ncbi:hypothetical protein DVB69_00295 [Sporosarcina sp. BI001-red]|uniref:hypothetical protein n=1 Tax=Sporosarcina sp. BI001-red TaxID=2282866 RepID=UPI000E24E468|nr:hypothetical protein [Sporosarcina sp. BI001-red]REB11620.1 hypothetical protein DVB69_00295 [Sporosarcina sp. BI001-red]
MKLYTDDELTQKLGSLSEPFQPTQEQKKTMHQSVFHGKNVRTNRRTLHWKPAFVSMLMLISIAFIVTILIGKTYSLSSGFFAKDVTDSWEGIIMKQQDSFEVTNYSIAFDGETMGIQNNFMGESFIGTDKSDMEIRKAADDYQAKLSKMKLHEGKFQNYTVKKEKERYTITVPGENGFTYTLEKTAPRQYVGEDGIRYSVNNYTD